MPVSAVLPLLYWILFNSVAAYLLMTWANKYADASKTLGYTALQPLTSAIVSWVVITAAPGQFPSLKEPGENSLGAIGILAGLFLMIYDSKKNESAKEEADDERPYSTDSDSDGYRY